MTCLAYLTYRAQRSQGMPPGRLQLPVIGETIQYVIDPLAYTARNLAAFKGSFYANVLFQRTVNLEPTAENIKFVQRLTDVNFPETIVTVLGRESLVVTNGPVHKRLRKVTARAFTTAKLDSYLPIFQAVTQRHLCKMAELPQGFELFDHIKLYAFEMAQRVLLGVDMSDAKLREFLQDFNVATSGFASLLPVDLPGFPFRKCMNARRRIGKEYQAVIDQKRAERIRNMEQKCTATVLDMIMGASEERLEDLASDTELQDFCFSAAVGGHDTITATMQNMIHLLDGRPALARELRDEIAGVWTEDVVNRDLLKRLHKCRAFVLETLRLVPPLPDAFRLIKADTSVPSGGYALPVGTTVKMGFKAVTDRYAGTDDDIALQSWLDHDGEFVESRINDFTRCSAFGYGARLCVGYKFAIDEAMVFLITLLRNYNFVVIKRTHCKLFPFNYYRVCISLSARV